MAGLSERGKSKAVQQLFSKTEGDVENNNPINVVSNQYTDVASKKMVMKNFKLPEDLTEALRVRAFETRRKEVDIVREALYSYFSK